MKKYFLPAIILILCSVMSIFAADRGSGQNSNSASNPSSDDQLPSGSFGCGPKDDSPLRGRRPRPVALLPRHIRSFTLTEVNIDLQSIKYERAVIEDLGGILRLYQHFDENDRRHLLVLPEEQRIAFFRQEISAGHVFVALVGEEGAEEVIGFCRMYVVGTVSEEIKDILCKELAAFNENFDSIKTESCKKFTISRDQCDTFRTPLCPIRTEWMPPFYFKDPVRTDGGSNSIWIYFGTNFIEKQYRGHGIDCKMERAALMLNAEKIDFILMGRRRAGCSPSTLYYMYGSIDEPGGKLSQARMRSFAWFIHQQYDFYRYKGKSIPFIFRTFTTFKPSIEYKRATPQSPHPSLRRHKSMLGIASTDALDESVSHLQFASDVMVSSTPEQESTDGIPGKGCFIGFDFEYAHEQLMGRGQDS